jgi:hypothetical protein
MSLILALLSLPGESFALDLDWAGQFRVEAHRIGNYNLDTDPNRVGLDASRAGKGGYYVPGGGQATAEFQTLFMRLTPRVLVNDNITLKSEWWVGDPIYGFYGSGYPFGAEQRQVFSTQNRSSVLQAQRFWAEVITDFGTLQVGRAPLEWGLGVVWHAGNGLFDRFQTTADTIRMVSKFGAFSFIPTIAKYSMGGALGGNCTFAGGACTTGSGGGGVSEYSLAIRYENPDEDFEGGVNLIRRISGGAQDPAAGLLASGTAAAPGTAGQIGVGANISTWDIYLKKRVGKLSLGAEVPIASGDIGGITYGAFAAAAEAKYTFSETWEIDAKAGMAPGQASMTDARPGKYTVFTFHPNYRLGLIMFNYQLANFAGPNSQNNPAVGGQNLRNPFDHPISNARYLSLGGTLSADKWKFRTQFITATAMKTAANGMNFYNTWDRQFYANQANQDQLKSLGSEIDLGASFQWDETFVTGLDMGLWLPGAFYKFSNTPSGNATGTVFALVGRLGINF